MRIWENRAVMNETRNARINAKGRFERTPEMKKGREKQYGKPLGPSFDRYYLIQQNYGKGNKR